MPHFRVIINDRKKNWCLGQLAYKLPIVVEEVWISSGRKLPSQSEKFARGPTPWDNLFEPMPMRLLSFFYLPLLALGLGLVGCSNKEDELPSDEEQIATFIKDNNLSTTVHPSGIHYIITTEGSGASPTLSSTVTVRYKGYLTNNKVFDQTTSNPVSFPLRNVIQGWQIALPLLKKGGKGTFIIPSGLAYGNNSPSPDIPNGATLVFEIELVNFF